MEPDILWLLLGAGGSMLGGGGVVRILWNGMGKRLDKIETDVQGVRDDVSQHGERLARIESRIEHLERSVPR